jgi:hypothetical protein
VNNAPALALIQARRQANPYGSVRYLTWTDASGTVNYWVPDVTISEEWEQGAEVTEHPVEQGANVADHVRVALPKVTLEVFATNEPTAPGNNFAAMQLVGLPMTANVWMSNSLLRGLTLAAGGALAAAAGAAGGSNASAAVSLAGLAAASFVPPGQAVATPMVASVYQFPGGADDFVLLTIQLLLSLKNTAQLITVNGSKQSEDNMVIEDFTYTRGEDEGTGATITLGLKQIRIVQTQTVSPPLPAIPRAAGQTNAGLKPPTDGTPAQQQSWLSAIAGWAGLGSSPHP